MDQNGLIVKVAVPVPEQCVGLVIGRNGAEVQAISQKSGCRVQVTVQPSSTGFRLVEIYGIPENIERAKAYISEVVTRGTRQPGPLCQPVVHVQTHGIKSPVVDQGDPSKITIEIPIPANKCGAIIGKGGEQMRKLRSWTNCNVQLLQDNNIADTVKPLKITGDPKQVEQCRLLVADILACNDDTPASAMMAGNGPVATMSLQVKVPRCTVGAIMGLQGKNIKKLSDETGTKIQFLPDDDPKLMERSLAIIGNKNKVYVCAQLIKAIVEANSEAANAPVVLFYMVIPASKCGLVIGRGGETIKQINQESGAHCELSRDPNTNPIEKTFVIRGSEAQVEHAKHLIRVKVGDIPPNTPYTPAGMPQPQPQQQPPQMVQVQPNLQGQQPNMQMWAGQPLVQQPQQPHHIHQQPAQLHPVQLPQVMAPPGYPTQAAYPPQAVYQQTSVAAWHPMQQAQPQQQQYVQAAIPVSQAMYQPPQQPAPAPVETGLSLYAQYAMQAAAQQQEQQRAQMAAQQEAKLAKQQTTQQVAQKDTASAQNSTGGSAKDGDADYSAQWLEYYIHIGDQASADAVRERIATLKAEKEKEEAAKEQARGGYY